MNKKIISIDVGIKNLAYCVLERKDNDFIIKNWDIINILDEKISKVPKCSNIIKDKQCGKQASNYLVLKTGSSIPLPFPLVIVKDNVKDNVKDKQIYFCNKITCNKNITKIYPNDKQKTLKIPNAKNTSILELASILLTKLNSIQSIILDVDEVIIENQPALKNPTMKSIQMIVFTYFVEHGYNSGSFPIKNIHLFSAKNKLKLYDGPVVECTKKNPYDKRKYLSVEYTKYYIKDNVEKSLFFNSHSKKDDLADSFIQGYYYLFKK
uniref:Mitochondrial resolvase Ydc2 catalytic domain-containing protein n=1 Tax=viral metagenome TaxID=1070528 RepID=A0A6C0EHH5_9ZZZZ